MFELIAVNDHFSQGIEEAGVSEIFQPTYKAT